MDDQTPKLGTDSVPGISMLAACPKDSDEASSKRLAVVLHKTLSGGAAANVAAVVIGGLRCEAFTDPVHDLDGASHAGVMWNMAVLRAKSMGQLQKLIREAYDAGVEVVAFPEEGRMLSNNFDRYRQLVSSRSTKDLSIVGVALFGKDEVVRKITRSFSVLT